MSKATSKSKPVTAARPLHEQMQTTAIHITKHDWNLLREVAFRRAKASGGRASVSEVVRALIEAQRSELERESKDDN